MSVEIPLFSWPPGLGMKTQIKSILSHYWTTGSLTILKCPQPQARGGKAMLGNLYSVSVAPVHDCKSCSHLHEVEFFLNLRSLLLDHIQEPVLWNWYSLKYFHFHVYWNMVTFDCFISLPGPPRCRWCTLHICYCSHDNKDQVRSAGAISGEAVLFWLRQNVCCGKGVMTAINI